MNPKNIFLLRSYLGSIILSALCTVFMTLPMACEKQKDPIKIGFSGCLTGQLADLGVAGRNAVMLAVEEINESGGINGRMVKLIVKDDTNTPDVAIKVDKELIDEGVVAIIGHTTSSMSIAALPVANQNKILMVSPTSTTNILSGQDDYFFRITSPDKIQASIMANYAWNRLNIKHIACVYDLSNQKFTQGWLNNFTESFQSVGGKVVYEQTFHAKKPFSYTDITKQLLKYKPDGILIISGALHTAMFCQQIQKIDGDLPIIASGWSGTQELILNGGGSVEGISFPQIFNQESKNPLYNAFKIKFMNRFKTEPNFASMCSYEAASLIFNAMAGWDRKTSLKQRVINQSKHQGLQGEIRLDKYGDALRSQFIVTVKNAKFSILETINP